MLLRVLISLVFLSGFALAQQNLTKILLSYPTCSSVCSVKYLAIAKCPFTDLRNCFCTNDTLQYEIGACVLSTFATTITQNEICDGVPKPWQGDRAIRATILVAAFTFPIIALRFITRIYITKKLWWDDWATLLVTFCLIATTFFPIYMAYHGFGTHFWDVRPAEVEPLLKIYYVGQIFYAIVQNIPKFSILLLYVRIFPFPTFRRILFGAMTWQAAHTIAFIFTLVFECVPIASQWDLSIAKTHCVDLSVVTYFGAGLSIFEDLVIMLLPVVELKILTMGLKKKIALVFMFALGSFACVTSMIRLKFVSGYGTSIDFTWTDVDIVIWSQIETFTAVICSCLICIRPLIVKLLPNILSSTKGSNFSSSNDNNKTLNSWGARVSRSIVKKERRGRYGETLDDEESIVGDGDGKGRDSKGNGITVTTERMVAFEMQRNTSGRDESMSMSVVAEEEEMGSNENLNQRSVSKI